MPISIWARSSRTPQKVRSSLTTDSNRAYYSVGISAGLVTGGEWPHAGGVTFTVLYSKRDLTILVLHFRSMVVDISDHAVV